MASLYVIGGMSLSSHICYQLSMWHKEVMFPLQQEKSPRIGQAWLPAFPEPITMARGMRSSDWPDKGHMVIPIVGGCESPTPTPTHHL